MNQVLAPCAGLPASEQSLKQSLFAPCKSQNNVIHCNFKDIDNTVSNQTQRPRQDCHCVPGPQCIADAWRDVGMVTLWVTPAAAQKFLASCMHCSSFSHATRQPLSGSACIRKALLTSSSCKKSALAASHSSGDKNTEGVFAS